jgi:cobalt-zinc-cadmium resistance protein CzcA
MNELIEGVGIRGDVGIKLFGPDREVRQQFADKIAAVTRKVKGAVDVSVETTAGLPLLDIRINRDEVARHGLSIGDVNDVIETALGGKQASTIIEGSQRFPLVVRLAPQYRSNAESIGRILIHAPGGMDVPLAQIADIVDTEGPVQLSRENGEGRTVIQTNVRGRDLGSVVEELQKKIAQQVDLPPGYRLEYGGTYEKLQSGRTRLMIVVPITFAVIFLLLFTTFGSLKQAALVFTGIPFAVTGGILALFVRNLHFSMSAGIGFIALFGVAVLNGVVLVTFINELREQGVPLREAIERGCETRLRPVLMTATVASIGFIPMAFAHGAGAEVQKPLATVVIGGLITSTLLTLFVLPTLYHWFERDKKEEIDKLSF